MDVISSDGTAKVPTAKSLELPSMAYTNGGTKLESAIFINFQASHITLSSFLETLIFSDVL